MCVWCNSRNICAVGQWCSNGGRAIRRHERTIFQPRGNPEDVVAGAAGIAGGARRVPVAAARGAGQGCDLHGAGRGCAARCSAAGYARGAACFSGASAVIGSGGAKTLVLVRFASSVCLVRAGRCAKTAGCTASWAGIFCGSGGYDGANEAAACFLAFALACCASQCAAANRGCGCDAG